MTQTQSQSLGQQFCPFEHTQRENPYPFYQQLREHEPVTYSPLLDAWLVTRYADLRFILSNPEIFSSKDVTRPVSNITPETQAILRQGYPMVQNAISSDGLNHRRFREPYAKAFAPPRIAAHSGFVCHAMNRLVDAILPDRRADVIGQIAYPLTLEVILHVMGVPQERMDDARAWSRALIAFLYSPLPEEQQIACAHGLVAFQHFMADLIEQRRAVPTGDVISELVHAQVEDAPPLSKNELVSALCGLLMAGHKTTIDLIGNGLAQLLSPRSRWEQLCAQPDLVPSAVEEILRYDSPVQALSRTTMREVTLGDITLPAETRLLLVFGAANRDEEQFPLGEDFLIDRRPNHHFGFGYGTHFCVGAPLARLEGRIAFEILAQRIPSIQLAENQPLAHGPILAFRGFQKLEIVW